MRVARAQQTAAYSAQAREPCLCALRSVRPTAHLGQGLLRRVGTIGDQPTEGRAKLVECLPDANDLCGLGLFRAA